ncbi:hypothetical protein QN372_21210 [Undibacterium sp. RTI2.1]|uniref:hypothetical protein n=1 Tax=unclassified Undibacterium TaxID=2630295 RepID=UPI002B22FE8F|nr:MULTISPECIES: hypothetical protein [unclassified Undibacterium]MEB0033254.1 hypothetical protein [Undibacterium sp. RTI2.1]MEB0119033.1 hypothetical protein [Undibacterium sp. RTI2.2]
MQKKFQNYEQFSSLLSELSDYEKCILFGARTAQSTLVASKSGEKIPAPVHRNATLKLEKLGLFKNTQRIALTDWAAKWVDDHQLSIPSHLYPAM